MKKIKNKNKKTGKVKEQKKIKESKKHNKDKKHFLSMDLTERMIRVEQGLSAKFDTNLVYDKTEYFKSLTPGQKEQYKKYLKNKIKKKTFFSSMIIISLLVFGALKIRLTGNVVSDYMRVSSINALEILMIGIAISAGVVYLISMIYNKVNNSRFQEHFDVLG